MCVGKRLNALKQWFSKCGLRNSSSDITWELVQISESQASPRPVELETLEAGPSNLYFNKLFRWLRFEKHCYKYITSVLTAKLIGMPYYSHFIVKKTEAQERKRAHPKFQQLIWLLFAPPTTVQMIFQRHYTSETVFPADDSVSWHELPD